MMIIPFLTFGKQTQSNYIYGFDANEVPVQIAYIFAALSVSISYVLQIQPVRRSVVSLIYGDNPPTGRRELFIRILIVTIVMLLTFGLATALGDDLNLPISITGLLGGNTMCFVMPFLLYLKKFGWRGKRDFMTIAVMGSLAFCVMLYPVCMSGIIYNAIPGDKPPTRV
jgi:amino acid permease